MKSGDKKMMEIIRADARLWSLYSCEEEYEPLITDKNGRFQHYLSQNHNVFEPEVSKYLINNGVRFEYPDDHRFALCITHDIDVVYERSVFKKGLKILKTIKSGTMREGVKLATEIPFKKKPWWNFHEIVAIEDQYEAKSTFFIMAISRDEQDWNYDIVDLEQEMCDLVDNGWSVGLHGGHNAYNNPIKLNSEKRSIEKVLGREVLGYRNHYLRFVVPTTWEILCECGFKYDSTYGYADCVGFRNGMCHPFKPYNRSTDREIDIIEIPLIVMDGTLFDDYMRLSTQTAWDTTKRIIDEVERCNGVMTILWHNSEMFGDGLKLFQKILDYCYEKKAWLASGDDIYQWYSKKNLGR